MLHRIALLSLISYGVTSFVNHNDECESKAIFTIHQNHYSPAVWKRGHTLGSYGCNKYDKFTFIAHGWGGVGSWVPAMVRKFLKYRGGCVIYFNFSQCIDMSNYLVSLARWPSASAVITKKLYEMEYEHIHPKNIFMYGFSLGGRIIVDGAINYGTQKVGSIDVCEPANFGFDHKYRKDPRKAAKNVQCIYTSGYFGSSIRNKCHQNWLMGSCGIRQLAANDLRPFSDAGSHGLCNAIYLSAFENDFLAERFNYCPKVQSGDHYPPHFKMGYRESRKHVRGVFAAKTNKYYPYSSRINLQNYFNENVEKIRVHITYS